MTDGAGPTKPPPRKKAKFKPKPKQKKLKQYFKKEEDKPEKNDDGYPIGECYYEPTMGRYIYQPPGYCGSFVGRQGSEPEFCPSCCLKPCITRKMRYQLRELASHYRVDRMWSMEKVRFTLLGHVKESMEKLLYKRHVGRLWPCSCCEEYMEETFPTLRDTWESSSSGEDEHEM